MVITGTKSPYTVIAPLAHTTSHRLYICKDGTGNLRLLQIAVTRGANGGLGRGAYILGQLTAESQRLDTLYATKHDGKHLHYDRLFPELVESFVSPTQDKRRVNILAFTDVTDVASLVPFSNLRTRDQVRLDLKTSAWVMGRLLKLQTFVHAQGVGIRAIRSDNILLDPSKHFAIVLDWSSARMYQQAIEREGAMSDIASAASAVMASIGGTSHGVSYELDEAEVRYVALLRQLGDGAVTDAITAHSQFYELVRDIWPNEFHPFTTLPL
ncbi:hypothetical protein IPM09_03090 [Candidatus Saccharibacteria bacterium]|nr:MAG: hypothetical protein IPM09_03090 [Candidatus Saccharibacteria bacterium]